MSKDVHTQAAESGRLKQSKVMLFMSSGKSISAKEKIDGSKQAQLIWDNELVAEKCAVGQTRCILQTSLILSPHHGIQPHRSFLVPRWCPKTRLYQNMFEISYFSSASTKFSVYPYTSAPEADIYCHSRNSFQFHRVLVGDRINIFVSGRSEHASASTWVGE
jgi:hypothetical protein